MSQTIRAAILADAFHEVSGQALTLRKIVSIANTRNYPLLCVHAGPETKQWQDGCITFLQLKRGPFRFSVERDLSHDVFLWRFESIVRRALQDFMPDVIHITSPGDFGQLGMYLSHSLNIPLAASWHTNLHDFAMRRTETLLQFLDAANRSSVSSWVQSQVLRKVLWFYKMADVLMAPNPELIELLQAHTGRIVLPMKRGVDTDLFSPNRRTVSDQILRLGFVGRLSPEKNVRTLIDIEQFLLTHGNTNFQFVIIGDGGERKWLEQNLTLAEFTGILKGVELAEAYANMDLFVFPSTTDTFGNVILEALASGVPAAVTNEGGPRFLVKHNQTGFIANNTQDLMTLVVNFLKMEPDSRRLMNQEAREYACLQSWDSMVDEVYAAYHLAQLNLNEHPSHELKLSTANRSMRILQILKALVQS